MPVRLSGSVRRSRSARSQEPFENAGVFVLSQILSGVEEDEQHDDRARPDGERPIAPPEDRVEQRQRGGDRQPRDRQPEEDALATDASPGESLVRVGHRPPSPHGAMTRPIIYGGA